MADGLTQRPFLGAGAGQRPDAGFVGGEFMRGSGIDHDAVVQHIGVVGDFETHARVLFDQQTILYFVFGPIVLLASVSEAVVGAIKGKNVLYNRYDVVIESVAFRLVASGILTALPFIFIRFHLFGFGGE